MKSFSTFLFESAAQQAARLGLVGDGHGGWYDKGTEPLEEEIHIDSDE